VRRLLDSIGRDGGYIAAPAHDVPRDAKPGKNIAAMIDTLQPSRDALADYELIRTDGELVRLVSRPSRCAWGAWLSTLKARTTFTAMASTSP